MLRIYVHKFPSQQHLRVQNKKWANSILKTESNFNDIIWGKTSTGKPFLYSKDTSVKLPHFNLSHSSNYAALAISSLEVGIDIEHKLPKNKNAILERFFFKQEIEFVKNQEPSKQDEAFLYLWTCKESLFKYIGCGLWKGISMYEIEFDAQKKAHAVYNGRALFFHSSVIPTPLSFHKEGTCLLTVCSPLEEEPEILFS